MPRRTHAPATRKSRAGQQVCHRGYQVTRTDCGKPAADTRWSRDWTRVTCETCKILASR